MPRSTNHTDCAFLVVGYGYRVAIFVLASELASQADQATMKVPIAGCNEQDNQTDQDWQVPGNCQQLQGTNNRRDQDEPSGRHSSTAQRRRCEVRRLDARRVFSVLGHIYLLSTLMLW